MERDGGHAEGSEQLPGAVPPADGWVVPGVHLQPAPAAPRATLAQLVAAVDAAVAEEPSGREADTALLLSLRERVQGLALRELAALGRSGDYAAGSAFPVALSTWVQKQQHVGDDAARSTVRLAQRLDDDLPGVREALLAGQTTVEHARAVHAGTRGLDGDLVRAAAGPLADLARTADPHTVRRELRERAEAIEPALGEDAARKQHQRRGLSASRIDGYGVHLDGRLGEEDGAVFLLGLSVAVQADRATSGTDDTRSVQQRQMDVVVGWARTAVATHGGADDSCAQDAHTVRTSFLVGCTPEQLAAAGSADKLTGQQALDLLTGVTPVRPAMLTDVPGSATLTAGALRRLSCDAAMTLVVQELVTEHGPGGSRWRTAPQVAPLYVGRSARTVSGLQFKALVARDLHCVGQGLPPASLGLRGPPRPALAAGRRHRHAQPRAALPPPPPPAPRRRSRSPDLARPVAHPDGLGRRPTGAGGVSSPGGGLGGCAAPPGGGLDGCAAPARRPRLGLRRRDVLHRRGADPLLPADRRPGVGAGVAHPSVTRPSCRRAPCRPCRTAGSTRRQPRPSSRSAPGCRWSRGRSARGSGSRSTRCRWCCCRTSPRWTSPTTRRPTRSR